MGTGASAASLLSSRHRVMPSSCGRTTSSRMSWYGFAFASLSPSAPFSAPSTSTSPSLSMLLTSSRMTGSSSTRRMWNAPFLAGEIISRSSLLPPRGRADGFGAAVPASDLRHGGPLGPALQAIGQADVNELARVLEDPHLEPGVDLEAHLPGVARQLARLGRLHEDDGLADRLALVRVGAQEEARGDGAAQAERRQDGGPRPAPGREEAEQDEEAEAGRPRREERPPHQGLGRRRDEAGQEGLLDPRPADLLQLPRAR